MDLSAHDIETRPRRRVITVVAVAAVLVAASGFWWLSRAKTDEGAASKGPPAIAVVTARVEQRDVPVTLRANGVVVAIQSVDLRAQVTSTVRAVHIKEGQSVRAGDLLFSLDSRADEANYKKALAQIEKVRADLATAQRNSDRQKELFAQKFISQSALDLVQNQVDTLKGQLAVDTAAAEASRVALGYGEIRAPFSGRTGVISVRAGSLVQPSGPPAVTVTQIHPIQASFTLPEKELAGLRGAMTAGPAQVLAVLEGGAGTLTGKLVFIDNTVDTGTGTIRVKAEFENEAARLWPGMYVNMEVAPRTILNAAVVPVQAVQTGPESRFVFVVGEDRKVAQVTVKLLLVDGPIAVIEGVTPGARVVTEGAQNLRTGSLVAEAGREGEPKKPDGRKGEGEKPA